MSSQPGYELLGMTTPGTESSSRNKSVYAESQAEITTISSPLSGDTSTANLHARSENITSQILSGVDPISREPENKWFGASWPSKGPIWTYLLNDWWLWEIGGILLSFACMLAVIIVLACTDGKPLRTWVFPMQPNSLISVFMTIAKASILVPVSKCIAQAKWTRFQEAPHRIIQVETYDEASRGPWGALQFLLQHGFRDWATSWGAILTVVALAIDPFTQQIIAYPSQEVQSGSASISALRHFDVNMYPENSIGRTIIRSIFDPPQTSFTCPSSNCRWPTYTSLGICSACRNLTSVVTPSCETNSSHWTLEAPGSPDVAYNNTNCTFLTPQGISLSTTSQFAIINASEVDVVYDYDILKGVPNEQLESEYAGLCSWSENCMSRYVQYRSENTDSDKLTGRAPPQVLPFELIECDLYWCAQVFDDARVVDGALALEPSATYKLTMPEWSSARFEGQPYSELELAETAANSSLNYTFGLGPTAIMLISPVNTVFNFSGTHGASRGRGNQLLGALADGSAPTFNEVAEMLYSGRNFTETMRRVARGLTSALQKHNESVAGDAFVTETFVRVRWAWMGFPLAVLLFSVLYLAVSVHASRRHGAVLWRTSSLALLFHGLRGWEHERLEVGNVTQIARTAREMKGQLRKKGDGDGDGDEDLEFIRT